jgi:hypothetical protein
MTLILDKENPLATKVRTRDGGKARIICIDCKSNEYSNGTAIIALIAVGGGEFIRVFGMDGRFYKGQPDVRDLVNILEENKVFIELNKLIDQVNKLKEILSSK